jgi:spermidine synthase
LHGVELTAPDQERVLTSYYTETSGVGLVLSHAPQLFGADASIGVVGLGAGTLACYAQSGQTWRFFEIDPLVIQIARDSGYFHFLSLCTPGAEITTGDARLELEKAADDSFDVLAVDAFSSDAIPMHLMTREAFDGYDRVVRPDGVVLVHISNRFINLEPVLAGLVRDDGWSAIVREDHPSRARMTSQGAASSYWVVMSRSADAVDRVRAAGGEWRDLASDPAPRTWTDDFASVLPLIK